AQLQQLLAAFGPSALNCLLSSATTPLVNWAQSASSHSVNLDQLASSPALQDTNNLTTPLVQSPPLDLIPTNSALVFCLSSMIRHNDPAMLPGFERILDEVKGNSDDGNSNNSVRPLAVQDKAPTGTPSQNIIRLFSFSAQWTILSNSAKIGLNTAAGQFRGAVLNQSGRRTATSQIDCPFKSKARLQPAKRSSTKSGPWRFSWQNTIMDHRPHLQPMLHTSSSSQSNNETCATNKTISNALQKIRKEDLAAQSPIEALLCILKESNWLWDIKVNSTSNHPKEADELDFNEEIRNLTVCLTNESPNSFKSMLDQIKQSVAGTKLLK
ncbi:hypothetical protein PSHT_10696, partial [Puccinia striiformis]